MKQWIIHNDSKKKVRGLRRRSRTFSKYITEQTESLPIAKNNDPSYLGYSYLNLSFDEFFIDSKKTPNSVRKFFVQTIINRIQHLIDIKTESEREYRVFCAFTPPNLLGSQITILFTKKGLESFYEGFFSREKEGRRFIPLHQDQSIEAEWGLHIPKGLDVRGYKKDVGDDDYYYPQEEIWLIGELD
jgi:hypothetical protein